MRTTLKQAKQSRIPIILEMGPNDPRVVDYINEGTFRLLQRSKDGWWDTAQRMRFCLSSSNCITWPRGVSEVRGLSICDQTFRLRNQWYEFLNDGSGLADFCNCTLGPALYDRGNSPLFDDILPKSEDGSQVHNKKVRFHIAQPSDAGKRILIQGTDENGAEIRSVDGTTFQKGIFIELAHPFVDSPIIISSISAVQKPLTNGPVWAYELDTETGAQRAIAYWEPDEENPSYRRSYLKGLPSNTCCGSRLITAMARLEYYPVRNDTDWLVIGNLAALKDMIQSIRKREANLEMESLVAERSAIRELNHELRVHGMEPAVQVSVFGSSKLRYRGIGKVI